MFIIKMVNKQVVTQDKEGVLLLATEKGVAYVTRQDISARSIHFLIFTHTEKLRLT